MDATCSRSLLHSVDEERALRPLVDAFYPALTLRQIASAYCTAQSNVDKASDILCQLLDNASITVRQERDSDVNVAESETSSHEDSSIDSSWAVYRKKGSKPKKTTFSVGTVSSAFGKAYSRPTISRKDPQESTKPPKIEVNESLFKCLNELEVEPVKLDAVPSKKPISNKDIEEFVFSMLGDGFKLSKDVIKEILGQCGYDIKKSMEELLTFSAKSLAKEKGTNYESVGNYTGKFPDSEPSLPEENLQKFPLPQRDLVDSNCHEKEKANLSREVLLSLFSAPVRTEEPRKRLEFGLNRTRVVGQTVVTKPPADDIVMLAPFDVAKIQFGVEHVVDEDESYHALRRATKEHWNEMKAFYEAAVDAFKDRDEEKANRMIERAKYHNQMAREADDQSSIETLETRESETQSDVPLDLHLYRPREALRLLKKHILSLANIPSFRYLKVTVNTVEDNTKGRRKREMIIKLLEEEAIKWTEEDAFPGMILIHLNTIDPSKLSFANDLQ